MLRVYLLPANGHRNKMSKTTAMFNAYTIPSHSAFFFLLRSTHTHTNPFLYIALFFCQIITKRLAHAFYMLHLTTIFMCHVKTEIYQKHPAPHVTPSSSFTASTSIAITPKWQYSLYFVLCGRR